MRRPAKLTDDQVREIFKSRLSQRVLGERYGVDHRAIGRIKNRETYRHVAVEPRPSLITLAGSGGKEP